MLLSIKKLLDAFENNKIIYCHWKSNEHLEAALKGDTDLDILFDYKQRNIINIVLNQCGLKRFRATELMQYNGIEDYIGFDYDTAKIWHLHIHYRMTLGEKHLKGYTVNTWNSIILKNRIYDQAGIYRSLTEIELILLIVRLALKNRLRDYFKKISKDDLAEFDWLISQTDFNILRIKSKELLTKEISDIIFNLCTNGIKEKKQLYPLQKKLKKELRCYTGFSNTESRFLRTKRELFWLYGGIKRKFGINSYNAYRRVSPSGGLAVCILGCDGAGKSTALQYIKNEFSKKLDVVSVYFGSGDGSCSLLRKPLRIFAKKVGGKGVGSSVNKEFTDKNKSLSFKSKLYILAKVLWAFSLALEKKKKIHLMNKARNNGLLVITDRYPQTEFAGCSDGPLLKTYSELNKVIKKIYDWEINIYKSAAKNPPDLSVKLIIDPKTAVQRKPEMTVEEIKEKTKIVLNTEFSQNTKIINTAGEKRTTFSQIMEAIWEII